MSNTRYVNGWECSLCYELHQTERKAKNCLKICQADCDKKHDYSEDEVKLISGFECCDCGKSYKTDTEAGNCCNVEYPEERGDSNYDKINYPNRTKFVPMEDSE